jgi:drug/metabolite transporter (DMT)-like permease
VKGYLYIALSAVGFGLMPVCAVAAYRSGVTVSSLLFLRFLIAAALLVPYAWWLSHRSGARFWPTRTGLVQLLVLGLVLYAAQSALYFSSVQYISPALAALLLYLYPGLVTGAAAVLDRRRPAVLTVVALLVSFAGVALALGDIEWRLSAAGIVLAVGAAVVYAVYILFGDRVGGEMSPVTMTAFISVFACCSFFAYGTAEGQLSLDFAAQGWYPVLAVAVASTVVAILCFFTGMALIGPTKAAIGSMLEPVASIVASAVLLGSGLTGTQLVGAVLVIAGATAGVLTRRMNRTPAPVPVNEDVRSAGR